MSERTLLKPISEPPTSEILRLRALAVLNGSPSSEELRRKVGAK